MEINLEKVRKITYDVNSGEVLDLGYYEEQEVTLLKFTGVEDLMDDGAYYFAVETSKGPKNFPLVNMQILVGSGLTEFYGEFRGQIIQINDIEVDEVTRINQIGKSPRFTVKVKRGIAVGPEYEVSDERIEMWHIELTRMYNELQTLKEDIEEKVESGYFKGEKGDDGVGLDHFDVEYDEYMNANVILYWSDGTVTSYWSYRGVPGRDGERGPQGPKGDTGAQGPQGIQGPKGDDYTLTDADKDDIANLTKDKINPELNEIKGDLSQLAESKMQRVVLNLVNASGSYSLKDSDGENVSFTDLYNLVKDETNYVVILVGNSKLRPQYVSTSEIHCDGEDRDSQGTLFLRMVMTANSLRYDTSRLADKSDLNDKVGFGDYPDFNKSGVIKLGNGFTRDSNGKPQAETLTIDRYNQAFDAEFIGKGTLENVLNVERIKINNLDKSQTQQNGRLDNIEYVLRNINTMRELSVTNDSYVDDIPSNNVGKFGYLDSVGGKSVVWNQRSENLPFTDRDGLTTSVDGNYTIINGTSTQDGSANGWFGMAKSIHELVLGHKYFLRFTVISGSYDGYCRYGTFFGPHRANFGDAIIFEANENDSNSTGSYGNILWGVGAVFNNLKILPILVDLTQLGYSDITSADDARIAWIEKYASEHPQYNAGEIISAELDRLESVGANICNVESAIGYFVQNNGEYSYIKNNRTYVGFINDRIEIEPNTNYHIALSEENTKTIFIGEWDSNGTWIERRSVPSNRNFTTSANAKYLYAYVYDSAQGLNDLQIAVIKGSSGTYTPYVEPQTIPLPTLDLKSAGSVHDKVERRTYRNMKSVDLGDLAWSMVSTGFRAIIPDSIAYINYGNEAPNYLCEKYAPISKSNLSEKTMCADYDSANNRKYILIKDSSYADATAFKNAMSGIILHYESIENGTDYDAWVFEKNVYELNFTNIRLGEDITPTHARIIIDVASPLCKNGTNNALTKLGVFQLFSNGTGTASTDNIVDVRGNITVVSFNNALYNFSTIDDIKNAIGDKLYYELATPRIYDITDTMPDLRLDIEANGSITFTNDSYLGVPHKYTYLAKGV